MPDSTVATETTLKPKVEVIGGSVFYGRKQALFDVSLEIPEHAVTALIGPSGCGKTTFLNCLNRLIETVDGARFEGRLLMDGASILDKNLDVVDVRRRFGVVAQKPNPFPDSVRYNVLYGPHLHGILNDGDDDDAHLEWALRKADLWEETKDRLDDSGYELSGGQQQRLCIARAISTRPDVVLMDEPCSAIDPIATDHIEKLIAEMKAHFTVVIITHSMMQARRVADYCAFFHLGRLVEHGPTGQVFEAPETDLARDFVAGTYG